MITANDLKTKGIGCIEESLAHQPEAVITVRGKESFVVMKIEHYHYLREMELEAALYESQQDLSAGRFTKDSIDQHVAELFGE
jgi:prevent-host-death family protein